MDVVYSKDSIKSYNGKKFKYGEHYANVIPLVIEHNCMIFKESLILIHELLPEFTDAVLSKIVCETTVKFEARACKYAAEH